MIELTDSSDLRIAVLGAGGMLGHKIYCVLSQEFRETYAVFRKCPARYAPFQIFAEKKMRGAFDARKLDSIDEYLQSINPDVVINCIGVTTRKLGTQNDSEIILVNSALPHKLKEWTQKNNRKLIHFSTDCVFSGKSGPYDLHSPRDAKDLYGQSKAIGEVEGKDVLTIRSSIIGRELEGRTELLEWFLSQHGGNIKGYSNVFYSGVTTTTMAYVVLKLLKGGVEFAGIQQLASEPISKFELLSLANEIFENKTLIEKVDQPASNKVLKTSPYFNDHGIRPSTWREQLCEVKKEFCKYERWLANVDKQHKAS